MNGSPTKTKPVKHQHQQHELNASSPCEQLCQLLVAFAARHNAVDLRRGITPEIDVDSAM